MQLTTILLGWQLKLAPWLPRLLLNPRAINGVIVYLVYKNPNCLYTIVYLESYIKS